MSGFVYDCPIGAAGKRLAHMKINDSEDNSRIRRPLDPLSAGSHPMLAPRQRKLRDTSGQAVTNLRIRT
jgi:hypothetical protein